MNTTESSFAPYPRPEPIGRQAKTRRWPWFAWVYVVGKDVKAGVYTSSGPDGSLDICYYAFKNGTGADADILDNNIVKGRSSVTLKPGQVFETSSCSDWIRQ